VITKLPHSVHLSLEEMHGSVKVPHHEAGFWEQWRAFVGPAILVSVGYMDPGNWGTDLQGGARFKYGLLWVVGVASLMAIFMQVISARLGVVTGKDLAQCCRDWYPRWTRWPNWLMSEVAIGACDLAEVLGSAVALNLLFHIPLLWAVIITGLDVLLLLTLQGFGMRTIEAIVLLLITTIGVCYFIEIFVLPQTRPSFLEMGRPGGDVIRRYRDHRCDCDAPTTFICTRPSYRAVSCRRTYNPFGARSASTRSTQQRR
jgi:manganese transport protein